MKKINILGMLIVIACSLHAGVRDVDRVIIWKYPLHSHTHSYIHWGFYRAFKHLGYETHWIEHERQLQGMNLANSLFFVSGGQEQGVPLRDDCYYIVHNCEIVRYIRLREMGRCIALQVYTHDCLDRKEPSFAFCFHYDLQQPIIYMPWATDLLPHEINANKQKVATTVKKKQAIFIGTINAGGFGNQKEITPFIQACKEQRIPFIDGGCCKKSMEDNMSIVMESLLAPAIQGEWQCTKGYIPCRIFKNISYGAMGVTNSKTVYELFNKKIIYNPDTYQLAQQAIAKVQHMNLNELYELMDFVRDNHTYLNRIESIFSFFDRVEKNK
jgi:hypothetical protein